MNWAAIDFSKCGSTVIGTIVDNADGDKKRRLLHDTAFAMRTVTACDAHDERATLFADGLAVAVRDKDGAWSRDGTRTPLAPRQVAELCAVRLGRFGAALTARLRGGAPLQLGPSAPPSSSWVTFFWATGAAVVRAEGSGVFNRRLASLPAPDTVWLRDMHTVAKRCATQFDAPAGAKPARVPVEIAWAARCTGRDVDSLSCLHRELDAASNDRTNAVVATLCRGNDVTCDGMQHISRNAEGVYLLSGICMARRVPLSTVRETIGAANEVVVLSDMGHPMGRQHKTVFGGPADAMVQAIVKHAGLTHATCVALRLLGRLEASFLGRHADFVLTAGPTLASFIEHLL
jgi:hypothetical protein